ncbi:polyprenyl synthetase family protein [Oceanibaculum indicum]|uniref:Octaprenyl diphosphate synthase n=1 Tax=Oceanibaculum indicum P24 TaxID=1207063 RepID=K2JPA2_9PROT|nr:geranylgeranyl pyrophosphate synthase [Oceanibaculum indicum P24]
MATATSVSEDSKPANRSALDRLSGFVAEDMERVNRLIVERMASPVALIPQLASHIVAAGGKRMRPMMTLAAAQLLGYGGDDHVKLATAVEFIHTATLLHDDVVDESDLRRGVDSANAIWGNKPSVLVGDFLFSRAFQLMVDAGSLKVLGILSNASAVIAEGEVQQLITANDISTDEAAYLQVIESKTAQLFAAAAQVGAVVAGATPEQEAALAAYGLNLGIAFQLTDDVLDYSAKQAELGKAVGDDFRDGKITLPIILAVARGDAEERGFWQRTLEEQDIRDGDLEHAMALMARHGTLAESLERARGYGKAAREALHVAPASPLRDALEDLIDFTVERAF